jgi:DNA-binding transcriptional regulator YiaG
MTMRPLTRDRRLTTEQAAIHKAIRELVPVELPEMMERRLERMATRDHLQPLVKQMKAAREALGLSLSDLSARTGMDRSALSKLETGQRPNPTLETLVRYAEAVGKQLIVSLVDE